LYNAKLHPEQYSDTFSSAQLKQLHKSILYVCQTAVDLLADSSKFPEDWLFKHRWGKGKKDSVSTLPNGAKITFLTVGGRTSCVIPSVQKKTGAVAGDVNEDENGDEKLVAKKAGKSNGMTKRKAAPKEDSDAEDEELNGRSKKSKATKISKYFAGSSQPPTKPTKVEDKDEMIVKKRGMTTKALTKPAHVKEEAEASGRRRSGRGKPKD
jgi:formamidopyrimidine-DNA glycosylase